MFRELSKKFTLLKTFFISFSALSLIVAILFGLAIAYYPGGNIKNVNKEGYSIIWNAMCNLGFDTSISGEINRISQIFFRTGLTLMSIIGIIYFSLMWIFFQERKSTKILSIIGSVLGVIQGGIFIGVAFTHGDIHMTLLTIAPLMEFFAVLPYTVVFMKDERVPGLSSYTFLVMFSSAILYAIVVLIGQIIKGDFFLISRNGVHTIFNFLILLGYAIIGVGTYLFMKNLETKS